MQETWINNSVDAVGKAIINANATVNGMQFGDSNVL